jgi:hypothetical protein
MVREDSQVISNEFKRLTGHSKIRTFRLNEKAMEICSEAGFCVEEASIKTTFFFHPWTKVGHGTMTAVVNCLK